VEQYRQLVADNPRDLGTLNKIGDLYVRLNRKPDAISTFTRICEIYAEDGFFLKAIAIYKKITKIDPSSIEIMTRLAELYARQGLTTEARSQYLAVAQAHVKSGSPREAIEAYEALATLEPESIQHRLALAELKSKCGMPAEAASTLLALGIELERKGNTRESSRIYELAFKTSGGDPAVAGRLASALLASGQPDRALTIAEKILESHPDSSPMLEIRGQAFEAAGRPEEAETAYKLCLDTEPEHAAAIVGLARVRVTRGAHAEAAEALSYGMESIVGAGKGQEATAILEDILEKAPEFRPALEDLYRLQSLLGDGTGTIAAGRKLIEASLAEKHYSEALAVARRLTELEPGVAEHTGRLQRIQDLAEGRSVEADHPEETVDLGAPVDEVENEAVEEFEQSTPAAPVDAAPGGGEGLQDEEFEIEEEFDVDLEGGEESEASPRAPREDPDRTLSAEDEEFIAERMTEADVFVKYGLSDRAIEQLAAITGKFPWHLSTRERLRDLYLEEGNRARAAVEAGEIGKVRFHEQDNDGATAALEEAKSIDPSCPVIAQLTALLNGEPLPSVPDSLGAMLAEEEAKGEAESQEDDLSQLSDDEEEEEEEAAEAGEAGEQAVEDSVPMAAAPAASASGVDDDGFDLAAELDASLFGEGDGPGEEGETVVSELEATPEAESLDDIVNAFKSEVDKQIDKEDFETHYDLGIAYKEMGLIDEAIAEFQFASKSPTMLVSCCSMLGMCFREKGMQSIAVKWYRKGLDAVASDGGTDGQEEQLNGLRYDLAEVLQQMGEVQQARDLLTEVYGVNSRYRDVAERMKALEDQMGG
jgi:tetratricopeptide (TPR) repeat protein